MNVPPTGPDREPEHGSVQEVAPTSVLDLVNRTLADPGRTANATKVLRTAAAGAARIVFTVGIVLVAIIVLLGALTSIAGPGAAVGGAAAAGGTAVVAGSRALRNRRATSRTGRRTGR
jgi:hypothetical protein